jgi:tetratricopeptide (TPR) repeat protein
MSYERGNQLYEEGRYAEAVVEYMRALADSEDPDLYENLGIALWRLGRWRPAARMFLRALDGNPRSREQSLRLLVGCHFRDGRPLDGERTLRLYEQLFGPHPEGWSRAQ